MDSLDNPEAKCCGLQIPSPLFAYHVVMLASSDSDLQLTLKQFAAECESKSHLWSCSLDIEWKNEIIISFCFGGFGIWTRCCSNPTLGRCSGYVHLGGDPGEDLGPNGEIIFLDQRMSWCPNEGVGGNGKGEECLYLPPWTVAQATQVMENGRKQPNEHKKNFWKATKARC